MRRRLSETRRLYRKVRVQAFDGVGGDGCFQEYEIRSLFSGRLREMETKLARIEQTSPGEIAIDLKPVNESARRLIGNAEEDIVALLGPEEAEVFFTTKLDQFHYGTFYSKFGTPNDMKISLLQVFENRCCPHGTSAFTRTAGARGEKVLFESGKLVVDSLPARWRHFVRNYDFTID